MPTTYLFCPLCFQKLDSHQTVYVSRPADRRQPPEPDKRPPPPEVRCDRLEQIILDDQEHGEPHNGIFLAHKNCSRLNPFCKLDGSNEIDFGSSHLKSSEGQIPETDRRALHYEVGILKLMSPLVKEMWFPAALLRITTPQKKKPGSVVVLAGATQVGKTILSLQAMHSKGFRNRLNGGTMSVKPEQFAYAPTPDRFSECVNTIQMLLHPNEALKTWKQAGTPPKLGELRAIFYRARREEVQRGEVAKAIGEMFGRNRNQQLPNWRTVLFYDVAGEHFEEMNLQELEQLNDVADSMAVVVEASSLLPFGKAMDSARQELVMSVACRCIDRLGWKPRDRRARWCLVVTKVDEIKSLVTGKTWAKFEHFAEKSVKTPSGVPGEWGEPIDLVTELMGRKASESQLELLEVLTPGDNGERPKIFFTWTDGLVLNQDRVRVLPSGDGGVVPRSYGLGKFIEWCLDESLQVINLAQSGG